MKNFKNKYRKLLPVLVFAFVLSFQTFILYAEENKLNTDLASESKKIPAEEVIVVEPADSEEIKAIEKLPDENTPMPVAPDEIPFEESDAIESESFIFEGIEYEADTEKLYEKVDAMEPTLMVRGKPVEEDDEGRKKERLRGRLTPEKHQLNRRKFYYRWVLKTASGDRIPLKSDLKLLGLVRKEELLDNPVMVTGFFIQSAMNDKLRYFVVERAVPAEEEKTEE
jgi:hypothetical protein